jgi:hypothetical protein
VIVAFVAVGFFGCSRGGIRFECVSGAQRFAFRARQAPNLAATAGCRRRVTASCGGGIASPHGKRVCGGGQTGGTGREVSRTVEVTLLLRHLWFPHIRQKNGVRGAAPRIVHSSLVEAKVAIYGIPDPRGVGLFLAVVLPPANRTEREGVWRLQCPVPAARASKKEPWPSPCGD